MRTLRPLRWCLGFVVVAVAVSGRAQAPSPTPTSPATPSAAPATAPAPAPATAPAATPATGDMTLQQASSLSAAEQQVQAQEYRTKMNETLKQLETLVEEARKQKDVIKLNCVNDKLMQVKGLMNVADQSMTLMQQSAQRGDDGARNHEFSRLTIAHQKVLVLGQEAETCVGEELAYVEKTDVDLSIDQNITDEDPTEPTELLEEFQDIERPPTGSPFD